MTNVTPFNGQASLFNLNTNTIPTNVSNINSINIGSINEKAVDIHHTEPSIISLENQALTTKTRKKTKLKSLSKEAVREFSDFSDLNNISDTRLEVDNNGKRHRRQTIITNASIFSLPAIPPALWNAERPVWIMGVPLENNGDKDDDHWFKVDANKLILLRQKSEFTNLTGNKNHPNITGSSSSIYAFHVRPPPRLKPITTKVSRLQCELNLNQHTRARSVGQMLTSEKSALNIA
ncbi:hypothetical protein Smp_173220 [Schistosoma mansoni]|uniref:hypothetical protein n=1 Tax=Schistosoma mansoni TaxID=6183 RepID=UPI0001A62D66|nr:hypothetical protein Smp_173220 [Schistosoma mansoni]|eukprot:XP_018652607.1 hypothetical protein Smp_173220 [Schistosoma mansoni]